MNELFEPSDAPKRAPANAPPAVRITYDDERDDTDPEYRYVVRRMPERGTPSPEP